MIDEEAFRGTGNVVAPPAEDNLAEDWDVLRGLPKYLYLIYPGFGCDSMELWRLNCLGQQKVMRGYRLDDQWVYSHDRPLWRGPNASKTLRDYDKSYRTSKRYAWTTLAEAFVAFQQMWAKYVEHMRLEVVRLDQTIEVYQRDRAMYLSSLKNAESVPFDVQRLVEIEDLK